MSISMMELTINNRRIAFITISILFVLCLLILVLCSLKGVSLTELSLFHPIPSYPLGIFILEVITFTLCAVALFILPGWLWAWSLIKEDRELSRLLPVSIFLSLGLLFLTTTVYKLIIPRELIRFDLIWILLTLYASGLFWIFFVAKGTEERYIIEKHLPTLFILLLCSLSILLWFFQDKMLWYELDRDFSQQHILPIPLGQLDDVVEAFGKVESLKRHILPFWDLEYSETFGFPLGVDPPLYHFILHFLSLLLGSAFGIVSMTMGICIIAALMMVYIIAGEKSDSSDSMIPPVVLLLLSSCYLLTLMKYLPPCGIVDFIYATLVAWFAHLYLFLKKRYTLSLLSAAIAFLLQYESAFFTCIGMLFIWFFVRYERQHVKSFFVRYIGILLGYFAMISFFGIITGELPIYVKAFVAENFSRIDYLHLLDNWLPPVVGEREVFSLTRSLLLLLKYLTMTGFTGALIFLPKRDQTLRLFSWIGGVYFFFVFFSKAPQVYYLSPLVLISMIVTVKIAFLCTKEKTRSSIHQESSNRGKT